LLAFSQLWARVDLSSVRAFREASILLTNGLLFSLGTTMTFFKGIYDDGNTYQTPIQILPRSAPEAME